jgi:phosphohistidine phosphatase
MLTLILLRHAKSSWDHPGLDDFERPLADRGLKAAPRMGAHLQSQSIQPDLIVCSSSVRTRQTLALITPQLDNQPKTIFEDDLYLATASNLLERIQALPARAHNVMLIGHNPGFHDVAQLLITSADPADQAALTAKFPTCAVAIITFTAKRWSQVAPHSGHLITFMTPSRLAHT